jgi:hypothetical protein
MSNKRKQAIGYLRTSSAVNVGPDKDSDRRQRVAIEAYLAVWVREHGAWKFVADADHRRLTRRKQPLARRSR